MSRTSNTPHLAGPPIIGRCAERDLGALAQLTRRHHGNERKHRPRRRAVSRTQSHAPGCIALDTIVQIRHVYFLHLVVSSVPADHIPHGRSRALWCSAWHRNR